LIKNRITRHVTDDVQEPTRKLRTKAPKTKLFLSRQQNVGKNYSIDDLLGVLYIIRELARR